MRLTTIEIGRILTRSSGFLSTVCSHSLQPYRGCALGHSLCGVGCYVRHNIYVTRGETWGDFVEARTNAAQAYLAECDSERRWARSRRGAFSIFLSSSTEPFQPMERTAGITRKVLQAMLENPPDELTLQTHTHRVCDCLDLYPAMGKRMRLRVHLSIESDRDQLPGLPRSASPYCKRLEAARRLKEAGIYVVITVAPLLPIDDPHGFFGQLRDVADAVVIDHFIQGDGSCDGGRTFRTSLPAAMAALDPHALTLEYRDRIVDVARRYFPRTTGINIDGFAGRWLAESSPTPAIHRG